MTKTFISEILAKIFINCDKETLNNVNVVCKQWHAIINQDSFWKQYYLWNYSNQKSLNILVDNLPNHNYVNLCKYKLEGKKQLITNIEAEDKKFFPIFNLNDYNIRLSGVSALSTKNEISIKHDCMAWLHKETNSIKFLEYKNPNKIKEFNAGTDPFKKIDIMNNLIVGISDSHSYLGYTIHIFSLDDRYQDLHLQLRIQSEIENGKLNYVDSFISDNLIIMVTSETCNKPPIFVAGRGWVNPLEDNYTTMIWDLNRLIQTLNSKNSIFYNEKNKIQNKEELFMDKYQGLYDKINHIKIPGVYNTNYISCCSFQQQTFTTTTENNNNSNDNSNNEIEQKFGKNYYYIICNGEYGGGDGESGKTIRIDILDENLKIEDTRIYEKEIQEFYNIFNWSYICPDGTIVIYCDRSLFLTSIHHFEKKIKIDLKRRFTVLNIMHTHDLLYVLYRHYAFAREIITLAIIDTSDLKNAKDEIPVKHIKLYEYDFGTVVYNRFIDTGIIHYNSKTNQIIFSPFSKVFC
ncbi:hypothetical protein BCR32DRAFT_264850 [Anaeromyces robustus]|uniref:F-box domain-containing protein n=1 Tax=Anaeromyces robustus TaxID=1754192 RepID=A0A1Y1XLU0_9FUNG|nr:hypothetical protein BCR32DRAFT_264850 [Anaeromyces robustus]|eukprot:ORX86702.1 hypothetical protein BCR32DRAFT_264850 [Anaeromyces robustus]